MDYADWNRKLRGKKQIAGLKFGNEKGEMGKV
jgi:hypothetical protein